MKRTTIDQFPWSDIQTAYDNSAMSMAELSVHAKVGLSTLVKATSLGYFVARTRSVSSTIGNTKRALAGRDKHTVETKERISTIMQLKMRNRRTRSKVHIYKGVRLESSYELTFAMLLDDLKIVWRRPGPLKYVDANGQHRRYYPDFYLPTYQLYFDPKNAYCILCDTDKIQRVMQQNRVVVIVVAKENLTKDFISGLTNRCVAQLAE